MFKILFLSLLWNCIHSADPVSGACCSKKTVGSVPYTLVDERDTSYFNCVSDCVYVRDDNPGGTRVCFGKGHLEVVCKNGSETTPPPIITNSTRIEGNETVVQVNTYHPAKGILEIEVPAHKDYPKTLFLHHQASELSMQKSNNVCQITDHPPNFNVSETAIQFTRMKNLVMENRYSLKKRVSKLSFEKRSKLTSEIQGHCENAQMVKTRDFDLTEEQHEKFKRGEVIFLGDKQNKPKRQSRQDGCTPDTACIQQGPNACQVGGVRVPGTGQWIRIHQFTNGGQCITCNLGNTPCGTNSCSCMCLCSSITDATTLNHCADSGSKIAQFKVNGNQERQTMEWNRILEGTSFIFKSSTMVAGFANKFDHLRQNSDENLSLFKFGDTCHIHSSNYDIYVHDIEEITSGNEYTTENDDWEIFTLLVDVGVQTTDDVDALHEHIKSQCRGLSSFKSVLAPLTKVQSQNLENFKIIVLETLSSRDNCKLQKAAVSKGFADWRYPNQDGPKLWIHETIHFVDEVTCCQSYGSSSSCCDDEFPGADKCLAYTGCQLDWGRYGSSCFRAFSNHVTWRQAQAACQAENGNLASIAGSITKEGVENLIETIASTSTSKYTDRVWIGLSRPTRSSAWEWVDNSPLNYAGWGQGSPSGDGDCAEIINDYGWNDLDCNRIRAYVCKKPAFTTSTCPEMNTDFYGNDLGVINNIPSWEDCVCECKKKNDCNGITWTPKEYGNYGYERCILKRSDAGRQTIQGAFSANIDCVNQC